MMRGECPICGVPYQRKTVWGQVSKLTRMEHYLAADKKASQLQYYGKAIPQDLRNHIKQLRGF